MEIADVHTYLYGQVSIGSITTLRIAFHSAQNGKPTSMALTLSPHWNMKKMQHYKLKEKVFRPE